MENYPTNSLRAQKDAVENDDKPDEKKIESVVTGEVTRRKKPLGKRLTETFVGGDAKSVWGYVVQDVLVPAARDMIADAVSQGVERMIFGEARSTSRRTGARPGGSNGYVSYNRMGSNKPSRSGLDEFRRKQTRTSHDFDEIILATRVEAEEVIDRLFDLLSRYEVATVSDLNELVGVTSNHVDHKWGWTNLSGAGVSRTRDGYLLDLPKPEPIE